MSPDPLFAIPRVPDPVRELAQEELRIRLDAIDQAQLRMESLLRSMSQPPGDAAQGLPYDEVFRILDGLDLAVFTLQREQDERVGRSRKGLEILIRKALEILERRGISPVPSVGHPFDAKLHQATGTVERPDLPDYHIVQQDRRGYRMGDRVLRPAEVVVNRLRPGTPAGEPNQTERM